MTLFPRSSLLSWFHSAAGCDAVARGALRAQASNLAIIGAARDCALGLKHLRPQIDNLRRQFRHAFVAIYENGSTDATKSLLTAWQQQSTDIYLELEAAGEKRATPSFCAERIQRMAKCRNRALDLMQQAAQHTGHPPDYVLVVDWDLRSLPPEGVLTALADSHAWDVLTANGLAYRGRGYRRVLRDYMFYDTYALRALADRERPQTEAEILANREHFAGLRPGQSPVAVHSGFGGAALYSMKRLSTHRYEVQCNADPVVQVFCEHVALHNRMRKDGPLAAGIHPALLAFYENPWDVTLGQTLRRWQKKWKP
jgi:hypothetical protein